MITPVVKHTTDLLFKNKIIKEYEKEICAYEIENILLEHTKVKEITVIDEFRQDNLTKVAAYISLKDSTVAGEELTRELKSYMKSDLEHFKCSMYIIT